MPPLSIVILTYNSEKHLEEVLKSASFADETLILDSGSNDLTIKIAESHGCRIETDEWQGFGRQKQKAVDRAKHDWVFVLDSDEIITVPLQKEIISAITNPSFEGYYVPRLNYFFGRPLYHGGLYPDFSIRLFNRNKGCFTESPVHEKVLIDGKIGILNEPMIHYAYETIEQFIDKQNRYSSLGAKPNRFKAVFNPFWTFFRMYIIQRGFLDGWEGFLAARLYSQYTFWKYAKGVCL